MDSVNLLELPLTSGVQGALFHSSGLCQIFCFLPRQIQLHPLSLTRPSALSRLSLLGHVSRKQWERGFDEVDFGFWVVVVELVTMVPGLPPVVELTKRTRGQPLVVDLPSMT